MSEIGLQDILWYRGYTVSAHRMQKHEASGHAHCTKSKPCHEATRYASQDTDDCIDVASTALVEWTSSHVMLVTR